MSIWNIAFFEFLNGFGINGVMTRNCISTQKPVLPVLSIEKKPINWTKSSFTLTWEMSVCPSEPVLWLEQFHQLSSLSQAWTRPLNCCGLIHLDWSNTIMNFVWHFPYSASCPVPQTSAKHRPEGYRFSIHAYAGWISVNIEQNQFGCPQESPVWVNCPVFLLLPVVK